jgi:PAS domain S-box-containing protein
MSIFKDGKIIFVNSAISRFLKYSKEEILSNPDPSKYVHPDDREMVKGNDIKKLAGKTGPRTYPFRILAKDGEVKWVEVTATQIRIDGKPATLNFYVNIAERIEAEKERARLEAQLQRSRKMEAVGTLAGGVAHDLNNILSGIVSYPDMLLIQLDEDSPLRNPILTMKDSGQKAAAIVNDLLTLARRGVITEEIVNLNDTISEYLNSPEFEKLKSFHPNVKIKTKFDPELLYISGSPVHLSKTVMNLVSNAAEAIEDKGTISISSSNKYIDKPFNSYENVLEGEYVVLTVSDTGIGIEPEEIEKIFEPFYTKKVMGRSGTGLGMAVVWGTVKDHEGIIDVNSTPGEGTTITIYFPASRMKVIEEKELLSMQEYMGRGERILVVDDVKDQREIASSMLNALGYVVETVPSGEEAVDYIKGAQVDLLLLDMIMDPGIDGLDTYKKCLKFNPKQKAIITSGFSETVRVKEAQKLGAGPYVKKPYTLETIGVAVKNELAN